MNIFTENSDLYPTPDSLISAMVSKLDWSRVELILEPNAGTANIVKYIRDYRERYRRLDISCIEIDDNLRNMLIGSGEKVIGTDFLSYAGQIQFDTIIMNPPFRNGEDHLLKAIDILFSGQIVCILNAETIRNPKTPQQLKLSQKLSALGADIEFKQSAFSQAERKTSVEIALIYISIKRSFFDTFEGATDKTVEMDPEEVDSQIKDVAENSSIEAIVADYNHRVKIGIETLQSFYASDKYIGLYMQIKTDLDSIGRSNSCRTETTTHQLKIQINQFLHNIRHDFWNRTLSLPEFEKRLTVNKRAEFKESLKKHSDLEFTVDNVRAFFENLMYSYEDTLLDAIVDLFDTMTVKYAYDENIHNKSVHYFSGWRSNNAFKIAKRVILPHVGLEKWFRGWNLSYNAKDKLDDIDKVMNYFDGKSKYVKISDVAESAIETPEIFSILESDYFYVRFYKKGTLHLTFKNEDIRRRFNIAVGKKKGWLPQEYGHTPFEHLDNEVQEVVRSFEESPSDYNRKLNQIGIVSKDLKMIA